MTRPIPRMGFWYHPVYEAMMATHEAVGCQGCKHNCCIIQPIMDYDEAMCIQAYLEDHPMGASQPERCDFLTLEGRCHIYPVRPFICRLWGHGGECLKVAQIDQKAIREMVYRRFVCREP